jgi:FkbM family methyltransferase
LVRTKIHGFNAIVPIGHWYLLAIQNYKRFNSPLLYLVNFVKNLKSGNIVVVDVGSAIGDTVLFIESKYPNACSFICIDGDDEYNKIIRENLEFLKERNSVVNILVSDKKNQIGKIKKENPTTGTSTSDILSNADSIDNILKEYGIIDILKIDIDGFDGQALSGAKEIIKKFNPSIIFEWNLPLFEKTKNSFFQPFEVLRDVGYNHLFWFDNFGNFLFYVQNPTLEELHIMASYSLNMKDVNGFHYDIIALNQKINFIEYIK